MLAQLARFSLAAPRDLRKPKFRNFGLSSGACDDRSSCAGDCAAPRRPAKDRRKRQRPANPGRKLKARRPKPIDLRAPPNNTHDTIKPILSLLLLLLAVETNSNNDNMAQRTPSTPNDNPRPDCRPPSTALRRDAKTSALGRRRHGHGPRGSAEGHDDVEFRELEHGARAAGDV
ncbi:hypothetical protein Landi51_11406 [Colletotrichum acutatum]